MVTVHANLTRTNGSIVRRGIESTTDDVSRFEDSEARHSATASVVLCLFFPHDKSSRRTRHQQADLSIWAHGMADRGWSFCWGTQCNGSNGRRISLDWNAIRIDAL